MYLVNENNYKFFYDYILCKLSIEIKFNDNLTTYLFV